MITLRSKTLLIAICLIFMSGISFAYTIEDNYIGAYPTHNNYYGSDRIGHEDWFEVYGMDVDFYTKGEEMIVSIHSTYFNNIGQYNTQLGDLFISTNGYNPTTLHKDDSALNGGEDWEYAFVMDPYNNTKSGSATLYSTGPGTIVKSTDVTENASYIYRADQEVQYNPGDQQEGFQGTWQINDTSDWLTFYVPWIDAFNDVDVFGFHWTMTCANDVIEGAAAAPVPEPATMLLLGTGLIGLAGASRKKLIKK
jgi:hypothetical protein